MKSFLFALIFLGLATVSTLSAQTRLPGAGSNSSSSEKPVDFKKETQLKKDIDEVGLAVANKIMRCCSSWGGNNVYAEVDYSEVRVNSITGTFTIPMLIGWYGSISGGHYWIKGKLIVNSNGQQEWLKIRDSGGFNPGCSKDCIR